MNTPQVASTVYIVDDDEAVRDSLRWLLEANGYRVRAYASAESFLNEYDEQQPGVLIVDVRMPGMSGLELQEQLIQRKSTMPIVFITGHGDIPMSVQAMKGGAIEFMSSRSITRQWRAAPSACASRRRPTTRMRISTRWSKRCATCGVGWASPSAPRRNPPRWKPCRSRI